MARSKKSKMTDEEYQQYQEEVKDALYHMAHRVNVVLYMSALAEPYLDFGFSIRQNFLNTTAKDVLKVIQSPVEVGDYCQSGLRNWRLHIRRLDGIAEEYLRSLYRKK